MIIDWIESYLKQIAGGYYGSSYGGGGGRIFLHFKHSNQNRIKMMKFTFLFQVGTEVAMAEEEVLFYFLSFNYS